MAEPEPKSDEPQKSWLEHFLGLFAEVHAGEAGTALLLTLNVFLLLSAYYVIKPVREALILSVPNGAEYKSYMGGAVALTLAVLVPIYGAIADRLKRNRLIIGVSIFFIANLVGFYFYGLTPAAKEGTGALIYALGFFLWISIFNMMVVAQFWAFAADLYTDEQGKRLFALVGIGASVGSVMGSLVVDRVVERVGTQFMLLIAAGFLAGSAIITQVVDTRETRRQGRTIKPKAKDAKPADKSGAYSLVLAHRYLIYIAIFTVVFTLVNSNGEYILGKLAKEASGSHGDKQQQKDWIAAFYGQFFLWVNIIGALVQSFLVSRIIKYGGLKIAFRVFPIIALISAVGVVAFPLLMTVRIGKTAENATDYSLNNTVRNVLWLPTTRRMKYLAKQAVDSFIVRLGDVACGGIVFVLAQVLGFGVRPMAITNVVLVGVWLYLAREILKENELMLKKRESGELRDEAESA